jgi:protoporphyrinogen oxidase
MAKSLQINVEGCGDDWLGNCKNAPVPESVQSSERRGDAPVPVVIMGAGPAGLTAAYELSKHDVRSVVLEANSMVGGIACTAEYKGYLFDMGGHRFFTKVGMVDKMWHEVLGDDFIRRPRLSRIFYNDKFFHYPLEPRNALFGLGLVEAIRCGLSYLKACLLPEKPENNFETWVSNRFGKRLYSIFFKAYTEKVWGIPCREIGAEWAAQRIRGLSLLSVVWNALRPKPAKQKIKTLIHEFSYPRKGPGMMWQKTRDIVEQRGSEVKLRTPVEKILWKPGKVEAVIAGGKTYRGEHFVSSIAIRDLVKSLDPAPPDSVLHAADDFHYRDFLTVALIIRGKNLFPDNWIYIHDPKVKVGRIQNYNNWSPEMVPDPNMTCLGLEYFCSIGDDLWTCPDSELIELAKREIAALGLAAGGTIVDGTVVRVPKAYPVYDDTYKRGLEAIRKFLELVPNLQLVGRNGMHRYNNQDHSMLTAMLAARNILGARYDLWQINVDEEYHEEGGELTEQEILAMERSQPLVPQRTANSGDGASGSVLMYTYPVPRG